MPKGTAYPSERSQFFDPQTGAEILQLTANPTISSNLYFENANFTPDSKSLIFWSRRTSERGAPWDLYRVDVDGKSITQLTDCDDLNGAALAPDGARAVITAGKQVRLVDLEDFSEEIIGDFSGAQSVGNPSAGGEYVFARAANTDGSSDVVRCDLCGGGETIVRRAQRVSHVNASPTGNYVAWIETAEINEYDTQTWYVMRPDGSENHRWAAQNWAHSSWVGKTDRMQGTLLPPGHGITWVAPWEDEPDTVVTGPYFWHSGASADGEWLVADTNWPDIGLQLVHLPSGRYQTLCLSQSTNGDHPTHPHPSFSPDGRKVLYNSSRTGITQIYLATIPDYLIEELSTGQLMARHRIGPRMV